MLRLLHPVEGPAVPRGRAVEWRLTRLQDSPLEEALGRLAGRQLLIRLLGCQ